MLYLHRISWVFRIHFRGFLMNIHEIFTPMFLQLRLFPLFRALIADSCELSQVIEERMNLEGLEDQAKLQMRPNSDDPRQNPRPTVKDQNIAK